MTNWLKEHSWQIFITIIGIVVAWTLLNARVSAVEKSQNEMEIKLASYPSQDYFDLKFKTIDDQLARLEKTLGDHINK